MVRVKGDVDSNVPPSKGSVHFGCSLPGKARDTPAGQKERCILVKYTGSGPKQSRLSTPKLLASHRLMSFVCVTLCNCTEHAP